MQSTHVLRIQIYNEYSNQPAAKANAPAPAVSAPREREPLPGEKPEIDTFTDSKSGAGAGTSVEDEPAGWTLKITGHLIDPTNGAPIASPTAFVFSNFISKMFVELDPKHYTGSDAVIEWTKGTAPASVDGFEIKRRGDRDYVYAKITLAIDYSPPRFTASQNLQRLLGMENVPEPKPRYLAALWQYIKV